MIFAGEDVADELLAVVDRGRRVAASILKRRGAAVIFAGEDVAGVVVRPAFGACVPGCRTLQRVEERSVAKHVSSLVAVHVSVGEELRVRAEHLRRLPYR